MAEVLVRDLDPTVVEKLKIRAKENQRSLQGELKCILEQAALSGAIDIGAERERIRSMFAGRTFSDVLNSCVKIENDDGSLHSRY